MSERSREIEVQVSIQNALENMKPIQSESIGFFLVLNSSIENVKTKAAKIEEIDLPGITKLKELKEAFKNVTESGKKLKEWFKKFENVINKLEKLLKDCTIPREDLENFYKKLMKMNSMAESFSDTYDNFFENLKKVQQVVTELVDELRKVEAKDKGTSGKRNSGVEKTLGMAALGLATGVFGAVTGGAGFTIVGAVGGALLFSGAGASGYKTYTDVKKMEQLTSKVLSYAESLKILSKELNSCSDRASKLKLDKEAVAALKSTLQFYKKNLDRNEQTAQQQAESNEREAENRELREQNRRLGND